MSCNHPRLSLYTARLSKYSTSGRSPQSADSTASRSGSPAAPAVGKPPALTSMPGTGAPELLLQPLAGLDRARRAKPRSRSRSAAACRPGLRSGCCRSPPARTGSRRCRRGWHRACATPACTAAKALARPVLRVLWKWQRSGMPGTASRTRETSSVTCAGTPTPIVSASAISNGRASATRCDDLDHSLDRHLALERATERRGNRHLRRGCRPAAPQQRCPARPRSIRRSTRPGCAG